MMFSNPWNYCFYLSITLILAFVAIIVSFSFLPKTLERAYLYQGLCINNRNSQSALEYLGSQSQIFTYSREDSLEDDPKSLLSQAQETLKESTGSGFVQLSENGSETKHYGVSMIHQLHCVEILRSALYNGSHHHSKFRGNDEQDHLDHCFQYLIQGIMCAADDTIEPSFVGETSDGQKVRVINGDGVVHKCRSFQKVHEAMGISQSKPFLIGRELQEGDTLRKVLSLRDWQ